MTASMATKRNLSPRRGSAMKRGSIGRDHQQFGDGLGLAANRPFQFEHQGEATVGNERERMRRIDRLRGQHRQDLFAEIIAQPFDFA